MPSVKLKSKEQENGKKLFLGIVSISCFLNVVFFEVTVNES
jgi:hypothetical protein